jgi:hypothetical protein
MQHDSSVVSTHSGASPAQQPNGGVWGACPPASTSHHSARQGESSLVIQDGSISAEELKAQNDGRVYPTPPMGIPNTHTPCDVYTQQCDEYTQQCDEYTYYDQ